MNLLILSSRGPNDEQAQDNLDIGYIPFQFLDGLLTVLPRHHLYKMLLKGQLHLAPIGNNAQVGCLVVDEMKQGR